MKKIPCLFSRDFSNARRPVLLRDVTPECAWVIAGEGQPTRKRETSFSCAHLGSVRVSLSMISLLTQPRNPPPLETRASASPLWAPLARP
jgi:hypothetical protein